MALKISTDEGKKIYITGATGWLGRTFLHELQSVIEPKHFNKRVIAFGSKKSAIKSTNYCKSKEITIPINQLSDLEKHAGTEKKLLIHCAFLTKDRMKEYGTKRFTAINQTITETVAVFLKSSRNTKAVVMSSGAASIEENKEKEETISEREDAYGYLKLKEERIITGLTDTQILRIYALTGQFIRTPETFAIGDLLIKAINGERLVINSTYPIVRSYCNASDIAKCATRWLLGEEKSKGIVHATSNTVSLTSLANLITNIYCLPPPIVKLNCGQANSYCHSPIGFDRMLREHGLTAKPLEKQIEETAEGIARHVLKRL